MKSILVLTLLIATYSLSEAHRGGENSGEKKWDREKGKRGGPVNFTCLTETEYAPLSSKDAMKMIKKNQTLMNELVVALQEASNATFDLTSYIKSKNGAQYVDLKGLSQVPGIAEALASFYQENILPLLRKEPSKECAKSMERFMEHLTRRNKTLADALVDFIKSNLNDYSEFIKTNPKNDAVSIDLDDLIDQQPELLYEFLMAYEIDPNSMSNHSKKPHKPSKPWKFGV